MPRWVWFMPIGVIVVALGIWGFRLGWIAATISETDVIEGYTARYMEAYQGQAKVTDCVGRPGYVEPIWIVVVCDAPDAKRIEYPVDRLGRLLNVERAKQADGRPKT